MLFLVYRNTNGFCIWILYPISLLSSLINSNNFTMYSVIFNIQTTVYLQIIIFTILPFQFLYLLISVLVLLWTSQSLYVRLKFSIPWAFSQTAYKINWVLYFPQGQIFFFFKLRIHALHGHRLIQVYYFFLGQFW